MNELTCETCHGYRLNDRPYLFSRGGERTISEFQTSIADHLEVIDQLSLSENEAIIARPILENQGPLDDLHRQIDSLNLTLSRSSGNFIR